MEKKRSVIDGITLNTATFDNEPVTPTYINLFFGRNGAGKSSIAKVIEAAADDDVHFKAGETKDNYDILLYDQDFIDDNFESYDNLQGVFTVNQVNIEIQKKIDALSEEKIQTTEAMSKLIEEGNKKKSLEASLLTQLQEECWKRSATIREDFDGTMSGKKRKNSFADKILATAPAAHDIKKFRGIEIKI